MEKIFFHFIRGNCWHIDLEKGMSYKLEMGENCDGWFWNETGMLSPSDETFKYKTIL